MARSYYDILGLQASASAEEIKKAYRKKAMESHPDVNKAPGSADRFVEINEAYAILGDADKRRVYNQKLRDQAARAAGETYARSAQQAQEEAYKQWVRQARAQADASARMNYQDFKKSRFGRTEASVFLYLQFLLVGAYLLIGGVLMVMPIVATFLVDWRMVFLCLIGLPLGMKIGEEGWRAIKEVKASL